MRCKKHPTDLSSGVGVCASCLRERLFAIMAAQSQKQALLHLNQPDHCRKSDTEQQQQPPPLSFPRSVSPYISRRKTDTAAATWHHQQPQRFHSTPLVGPTGSINVQVKQNKKRSKGARFSSMFLGLFRSKSDKIDLKSDPPVSIDSCTASPSWFSTVISGRRKKQIRTFSLNDEAIGAQRRTCRYRDRGMSPARHSDEEDGDEHCHGGSSGYSSESSQGWRQTPRRTPATTRRRGEKHSRNVSGLTFCLSPLVRASPSRNWNQKAVPPEMATAGESRAPKKPYLSTATSFCKNRSRKLADFGRYSYNTNH
ncbi:hypothetical protein BUALT_Bualt01G0189000 [Buddleja alternifolia]|uniref:Uncharacterized protein n=1 Tax=Buddleja alternifolia TaxID=168488 RepID=A0AAV6Y9A9_9LAMI|nr:hypothetical protein BUALT_Bualt01G0189000 [Buddleja alternifolia]